MSGVRRMDDVYSLHTVAQLGLIAPALHLYSKPVLAPNMLGPKLRVVSSAWFWLPSFLYIRSLWILPGADANCNLNRESGFWLDSPLHRLADQSSDL